jgi:hypothetical protein
MKPNPDTEKSEVEKYLNCRIAIIEIRPGETTDEAWSRHLAGHPEDFYVNIKIFNDGSSRWRNLKEQRASFSFE